MRLTIEINTGADPDPVVLQQLLGWAVKADTALLSSFRSISVGGITQTDAVGVSTVTLNQNSDHVDDSLTSQGEPATDATSAAKKPKSAGRKGAASVTQNNAALTGPATEAVETVTVVPPSIPSAGTFPAFATTVGASGAAPAVSGMALPPGAAHPAAGMALPPGAAHPAPLAPVAVNPEPRATAAMPYVPTAPLADPRGAESAPSLEDFRACFAALNTQKAGAPFKVMQSGAWPTDNTPKARWFTAESVPATERERLMGEMAFVVSQG